jgi:RNA polymerase sigma factor (sigma-70 family)
MATGALAGVVRHLQRAALRGDGAGPTDGELLESFITRRDPAAFECLIHRHGPMVQGVCRRLLRNEADVEDAFQATFLVLVRKADSVCPRSRVGGWLYGVARHTALKARALIGRRGAREVSVRDLPEMVAPADDRRELLAALDEALGRLPEKYRLAVVLCALEGLPLREAARQLGWPEGTVASRLARGRALLARRLARGGLVLSAGSLAAEAARAAVPVPVLLSTVRAALQAAAGDQTAAAAPAVAALTEGVVRHMLFNRIRHAAGLLLLAALGVGLSLWLGRGLAQENQAGSRSVARAPGRPTPKPAGDSSRAGRIYFQSNLDLITIQPDGKKPENLAALASKDILGYQPHSARLSPDGKRLAFGIAVMKQERDVLGVHPPDKILLRDVARSAPGEVLVEMPGVNLNTWCWSPDGRKLAFWSWDKDHHARNWVVDVKSKKVERLKLPRIKVDGKEQEMGVEAWSPDGKAFLAFGAGLHLVKADGASARRLTGERGDVLTGSARFSPDGRKVLFTTLNPDRSMTLHVADVAGGKIRPLVDARNFGEAHGCWSPDGRRIAYCVTLLDEMGNSAGQTSIFVTDAAGRNTTTLVSEQHQPGLVRFTLLDWR